MEKDGVSPNDLTVLMTQLWCRDFQEYRGEPPDRARVQLSAAMLLYCFTSARTGEVHESTARRGLARGSDNGETDEEIEARVMAACYKVSIINIPKETRGHICLSAQQHFDLSIERVDGLPMLVLTYQREFSKGHWRKKRCELPVHAFYEVYKEDVPLFLNFLTFFLPMASADGAFRNYSSVLEILKTVDAYGTAPPMENKVLEVITFKECVQHVPVFRPFSELHVDKSTGKARGADAFGKELVRLGHRSGYVRNVTIRGCRRWALMEAGIKQTLENT